MGTSPSRVCIGGNMAPGNNSSTKRDGRMGIERGGGERDGGREETREGRGEREGQSIDYWCVSTFYTFKS